MTRPIKPLDVDTLARLFLHLAQMENAGLAPTQALGRLNDPNKALRLRLSDMRRRVQAGWAVADAGFRAGIFDQNHKILIQAAEGGGRLAAVYRQLANRYHSLSGHRKRTRSRLYLPTLVLLIALFLQPSPAWVMGTISNGQYVGKTFGTLAALGLAGYSAIHLPRWLGKVGLKPAWDWVLLQLPVVGDWLAARELNTFLFMLALLLDAGVPFSEALPGTVATIENDALRARFKPALAHCHSGAAVATVLRSAPVVAPEALQVVASAEQSGRLSEALLHFVGLEAESIALQDDMLAEWLPRLVYGVIAGWMGYSVLDSGVFLPR